MRVVNDRRGSTRVTVRGEALVHAPQGPVRCRCLDISASGMSLVCPQAIKPKQRVRIESSFKGQRLVLEAVVVRRNRTREGHVLGLRFEATTPEARDRLHDVLRSMQVQAALAMQACAIVDRLPVLQIPAPEPEPRTEKTPAAVPMTPPRAEGHPPSMPRAQPHPTTPGGTQQVPVVGSPRPFTEPPIAERPIVGGTQAPVVGSPMARAEAPAKGGTQELPMMGPPPARAEAPAKGGTQELPMMGPPPARAGVPAKGGTQELPMMPGAATPVATQPMPRPRVATPAPIATQPMPRPRVATPRPRVATPSPSAPSKVPTAPPLAPTPSQPAAPTRARRAPVGVEEPERLDKTMLTPPSQLPSARWPGGGRPVGLDEGWTEEELVTTHYRPASEDSQPLSVPRGTPPGEPPASLVDAFELGGDAADRTEVEAAVGAFTVAEAPLPEWEVGAPVDAALCLAPVADLELDLPVPPVVDRTLLGPRPPAIASLAAASPGTLATEADDDRLGPVRTGKTMVMHVKDLIAAHAPPVAEPELDLELPEETAPATAPTIAPRLSDELQAALDRLRRREAASTPVEGPGDAEAAPRAPTSGRRRRRPGATDAHAAPGRDDTQVRALYHAALANLGDPDRGDGS